MLNDANLYPANPLGRSLPQEIARLERIVIEAAIARRSSLSLDEARTVDALLAARDNNLAPIDLKSLPFGSQKVNHAVSSCMVEFRDSIRGLECAVIDSAIDYCALPVAEKTLSTPAIRLEETVCALMVARKKR